MYAAENFSYRKVITSGCYQHDTLLPLLPVCYSSFQLQENTTHTLIENSKAKKLNVLYQLYIYIYIYIYIQSVSGGIVNILGGGSMDYSE